MPGEPEPATLGGESGPVRRAAGADACSAPAISSSLRAGCSTIPATSVPTESPASSKVGWSSANQQRGWYSLT